MVKIAALSKLNAKPAGAVNPARLRAGFTLVELVVAIAVVGMLAAIAIPSFSGMIANNKAKGIATDLYMDVTISPVVDGWKKGWSIYPTNQSDNVLESHSVSGANVSVSGPGTVKYNSSGRIGGSVSFDIEATVGSASANTCVTVSLSGLPSVKNSAC